PPGADLMPKPYGRSYSPVGVVFVFCLRDAPSTSPFAPNRADAEPAFTHRPPRRSHQMTSPVVELAFGATAVISWVPPPVSAIRAGRGAPEADAAGTAPRTRSEAHTRAPAAR